MTDRNGTTNLINTQQKITWSQASFNNTKLICDASKPLTLLAQQAQDSHQDSPIAMLLNMLSASQTTNAQNGEKLDKIIELLSAPVIEKAVKEMLKG